MRALAVIPARYGSTRFPGKPLVAETGKPLIQHVVEQVERCATIDRVVVATDDERILDAVRGFGAQAVMTRGDHLNGTSRIAEAVDRLGSDQELIVNVQGDEPEVPPETIDALVRGLAADAEAEMATLASRFDAEEDPSNPNVVKLVLDRQGRAMYFSRSVIPYDRDAEMLGTRPRVTMYKHPGLYAYRRGFLALYPTLPPTPLEEAEKLEQLRVLEHGHRIAVIHAEAPHPGIDTPEQYAAFVARYRAGGAGAASGTTG
ncbi:MAG: 3-deoxy-manno-octulosonate cytidylyltransferase [Planctomycetota bacterium]